MEPAEDIDKNFEKCWLTKLPKLFYKARRLGLTNEEAEDIVQVVCSELIRRVREGLDGNRDFCGQVTNLAFHRLDLRIVDHWRRKGRRPEPMRLDEVIEVADERKPEIELQDRRLQHCWSKLTDEQQAVLELRIFEGLSYKDVGDRLCITEGAAKGRGGRGLKDLRACMGRSQGTVDSDEEGEGEKK